jgi:hypothetical protein
MAMQPMTVLTVRPLAHSSESLIICLALMLGMTGSSSAAGVVVMAYVVRTMYSGTPMHSIRWIG